MKLVLLRGLCDNGRTCPTINATDRETFVVQGYVPSPADCEPFSLAAGESIVEIPLTPVPEADTGTLYLTGRGTAPVRGTTVLDADALAELRLPNGESAVEVPASTFPRLNEEVVADAR